MHIFRPAKPSPYSLSMKNHATYFVRNPGNLTSDYADTIATHIAGAMNNGEYARLNSEQINGLNHTALAIAEVADMVRKIEGENHRRQRRLTRWQRFVSIFQKG